MPTPIDPVAVPSTGFSVWDVLRFRFKVTLFQLRRSLINRWVQPVPAWTAADQLAEAETIAESITPLWTATNSAEQSLLAGKVQNLRVAIARINGIEIPAGELFSFWAQIGRPSRQRGYVKGRELRQGCVIPSLAGGLCQLSNALYSAALDAGLNIVERHAHTQIIPGSLAAIGRDATVFWNYVDLRFKSDRPLRIEAELTAEHLVVRLKGSRSSGSQPFTQTDHSRSVISSEHNCVTCGVTTCAIQSQYPASKGGNHFEAGRTAFLVDDYWPESDHYLQSIRQEGDILCLPLDGATWKKANYAWQRDGFESVYQAPLLTLSRSLAFRRLPAQGASFQQLLLEFDQKLARHFASRLTYDITHIVTTQSLLPWLWQSGCLGGRTFDVLMTRLPLGMLQARLDHAAQKYPDSPTLGDFRVDQALVNLEQQALTAARNLITPHSEIASLFPEKTQLLNWQLPVLSTSYESFNPAQAERILFPASTLARKGAYELRAVAQQLGLTLTVPGRTWEGADFWQGVSMTQPETDWLEGVKLVVLPAYVEHQPRLLLRAIARGIPVIASSACGLAQMPGVTTIPVGDTQALAKAMSRLAAIDLLPPSRL